MCWQKVWQRIDHNLILLSYRDEEAQTLSATRARWRLRKIQNPIQQAHLRQCSNKSYTPGSTFFPSPPGPTLGRIELNWGIFRPFYVHDAFDFHSSAFTALAQGFFIIQNDPRYFWSLSRCVSFKRQLWFLHIKLAELSDLPLTLGGKITYRHGQLSCHPCWTRDRKAETVAHFDRGFQCCHISIALVLSGFSRLSSCGRHVPSSIARYDPDISLSSVIDGKNRWFVKEIKCKEMLCYRVIIMETRINRTLE